MKIRRKLMMQESESELYPVGTDLYAGLEFQKNASVDRQTGEVVSGENAVSDYIEVSMQYEYTRSYRLYGVYNYDENHNLLGYQAGANDLNTSVILPFITGTKYIRTEVHTAYVTGNYITQDRCWLKRTA